VKQIVWTAQATADVRSIDQPVALQILKTPARYASSGEGDTKQLQGVDPPLIRLRAPGPPRLLPRQGRPSGDLPRPRSQGSLPLRGRSEIRGLPASTQQACSCKNSQFAYRLNDSTRDTLLSSGLGSRGRHPCAAISDCEAWAKRISLISLTGAIVDDATLAGSTGIP
jgi:hypothetical protein